MKKVKTIFRCALVLIGLMTFSCNVENEARIEAETSIDTETEDFTLSRGINETTVLIQWHEGISEQRKCDVRQYYMSNHILLYYKLCGLEGYETWFIDCEAAHCKDTDTPVDTDDDVHRASLNKTCKDI